MATQALYLKWRPQEFDEVIGQDHITRTLRNALRQNRIRHAYLFSGPRGTGKTTNARLLAKAVNCTHDDPEQRPCNECAHCLRFNEGRFLDLIEIDAASHTSVDDVRDLREKIAFSPSEGRYKVYIVDEVHRFSGAAFDALLKTLEEPPAHAIFILATTEIDKVPATIKSRCLLFEFRRVPLRQVVERLQKICDDESISIDPEALELIARQGTGSVRDSISLLDQVVADPDQHVSLELAQKMLGVIGGRAVYKVVDAIIRNDASGGLEALNDALDQGADPRQFGQQLVDYLRNVMLVQVGGKEIIDASNELRNQLEEQSKQINRGTLTKAIRAFNSAIADLRSGWQPQLPLELALVESTQPVQETVYAPAPPQQASVRQETKQPAAAPVLKEMPAASPGEKATLQEVRSRWKQIIQATRESGKTIHSYVEKTEPYKIEENTLFLVVTNPSPSIPLKLKDRKNQQIIHEAMDRILGYHLNLSILTNVDLQKMDVQLDDVLTQFASEFGAEVKVEE